MQRTVGFAHWTVCAELCLLGACVCMCMCACACVHSSASLWRDLKNWLPIHAHSFTVHLISPKTHLKHTHSDIYETLNIVSANRGQHLNTSKHVGIDERLFKPNTRTNREEMWSKCLWLLQDCWCQTTVWVSQQLISWDSITVPGVYREWWKNNNNKSTKVGTAEEHLQNTQQN